ncbi:MAG: flagellar type III secretion system pore protein FliP [Deltaproteobacteria bacterium]|nr:flagellar type III secretion system pore protein FliP [Deltaproteobacteria bacterium]
MVEVVAALGAVLLSIVVLRKLLVRFGPAALGAREPGRIRIVDSAALSLKQNVHLVEVDGERLLIGAGETGLVRLARLAPRPATANASVPANLDVGGDTSIAPATRRGRAFLRALGSSIGALGPALLFALLASAGDALAADTAGAGTPTFSVTIDGATAPDQISDTLKIVLVLTAISVAPSLLLMTTCFTRILIVLALLRQALGTATLPPNQVLVGLALMTTIYVMTPVGEAVYADAVEPYMEKKIGGEEALERGIVPVRDYMLRHARENDLLLFVEMKGDTTPEKPEDVSISTLLPAFMISEMRAAFEIGFMIYLPFLVVDLVIASMLISLGMIMLPPVMIALPFKLMLFVLVDGWNLTLTSLVAGLQ